MRRPVNSQQVGARLMGVIKGGLGAPTLSGLDLNQVTVVDNGVGDYNINVKEPFGDDNVVAQVTSLTVGVTCTLGTVDKTGVQILCWSDLAQTVPAEGNFHLSILGSEVSTRT